MSAADWSVLVGRHANLMARNPELDRVDPELWAAVEKQEPMMLAKDEFFFRLWPNNFGNRLRLLLTFNKLHTDILMRKFDRSNIFVRIDSTLSTEKKPIFQFELAGISRGQPKLVPGDMIILDNEKLHEPKIFTIEKIVGDSIKFSSRTSSSSEIPNIPFNISFHSQGIPMRRCIKNLYDIEGLKRIQQMLFKGNKYKSALGENWEPEPEQQVALICEETTRNIYVNGRLKGHCNELQRQAIVNIMEAKCRPSLYILFGPPGTGKTATLIETAGQIVQRNQSVSVLICAQSNNCVDDLALKLLSIKCIRDKHVIRLCSMNYYTSLLEKDLPIPDFYTDDYSNLDTKRVIITTNLMTAKLDRKFDYVLMDEAGHATIPESLLPCSKVKDDGCFVLAGDPKQLGPVVPCYKLREAGLGQSLLKRMFGEYLYGQHNGKYDPRYITKLVTSYRSDPRLMAINNKEFYRDELEFKGKTPAWILEELNFDRPLVFKRVRGKTESLIENYPPSWKNDLEAETCIELLFKLYLLGLEPDQIGVITYYSLQKAILMEMFERKLNQYRPRLNALKRGQPPKTRKVRNPSLIQQAYLFARKKFTNSSQGNSNRYDWHCKIDTIDAFQGNERDVIIISTTLDRKSQFLNEPTRFNVATSRARWLTVIVGHPDLLNFGKYWKKLAKEAYLA